MTNIYEAYIHSVLDVWWYLYADLVTEGHRWQGEKERETEKEHVGTSREMEMLSSLNDIDVTVVQTDWS